MHKKIILEETIVAGTCSLRICGYGDNYHCGGEYSIAIFEDDICKGSIKLKPYQIIDVVKAIERIVPEFESGG